MTRLQSFIKAMIYTSSIAWLIYTLLSLPNTIEAQTNGVITAIISLINMVVNDLNNKTKV